MAAVRNKSKKTSRTRNYRSMLKSLRSQSSSLPSPSEYSSEGSQKSVCIIASFEWIRKNETYCFKFDPSSLLIDDDSNEDNANSNGGELNRNRALLLSPTSGTCKINKWGGCCYASLGSTMYWFGRNIEKYPRSNFPESGWKHGPPMIADHRIHPNKTVIGGKLYVFGGAFHDRGHPWGEFFDPIEDKWEALPDPPVRLDDSVSSVFSESPDNKILVGFSESGSELYGYDPVTNSWGLLCRFDNAFGERTIVGKAELVNNTLYWFYESRLKLEGYDLEKGMWFVGHFKHPKLDGLVVSQCRPYFFHLGGGDENFCMLWEDKIINSDSEDRCVIFVKFRVTKRIVDYGKGEGVLDMHIQSSQMLLIDSWLSLQDVFVMLT